MLPAALTFWRDLRDLHSRYQARNGDHRALLRGFIAGYSEAPNLNSSNAGERFLLSRAISILHW
jgi:hypothetical protein